MKKADLSEDPIIGRLKYAQGDFGILAKQPPHTGLAAHQRCPASSTACVTKRSDHACSLTSSWVRASIFRAVPLSSDAKGSSMINRSGLPEKARARDNRLC